MDGLGMRDRVVPFHLALKEHPDWFRLVLRLNLIPVPRKWQGAPSGPGTSLSCSWLTGLWL